VRALIRTAVAFVLAPLGTPLVVWAFFVAARLLGLGGSTSDLTGRAGPVAGVATVFAYLTLGLIGIPVVWWWARRRPLTARDLARLGLALGGLPFVVYGTIGLAIVGWETLSQPAGPVYGGWERWARQLREAVALTVLAAASGLVTALLYWTIALRPAR
jgi:hypothetical protein